MGTWTVNANPLGNVFLSALVAVVPIAFLFWALAIRRMKGHYTAILATAVGVAVAVAVFGMPAGLALRATAFGMAYGLWPVAWIVITAVFLYNLSVQTGQFEVIKNSLASISDDRRIQALLIAFSFGAFLEGAAGFGTPVAISGAMLVGLGFDPLYAAGICLIANTAPVAFGAIGIDDHRYLIGIPARAGFALNLIGANPPPDHAFHLDRALYLCDMLGLDSIGVVADRRDYTASSRTWWSLRESVATVAAWMDGRAPAPASPRW